LLLDVREPEEYTGELGHIPGSLLVSLKDLPVRASELELGKKGGRAMSLSNEAMA
jgi:3-mercaptopyruvate sulfurtransferase SseA